MTMSMYMAAAKTKEEKIAQKIRDKRQRMVSLMVQHAARINTAYREGQLELEQKLIEDDTWFNDSTGRINEVN